jgi:hypothetical protein
MPSSASLTKTAGVISTLAGLVVGAFSLWFFLENRITSAVKTGTEVVTKDVQSASVNIISVLLQDMKMRLHLLDTEINALRAEGKPVPERLIIHQSMLKGQIEDTEKKWLKPQTP